VEKEAYKVVLTDNDNYPIEIEKQVFSELNINFIYLNTKDPDEIIKESRDADALMCAYARIDSAVIAELKKCRVIVKYGIGVDNIDIEAASKAGIWVANLPDYAVFEVANHTIALILALNRKITLFNNGIRKGSWGFTMGIPINRIDDQILGLIGFGNIAQKVAQKAQGIGLSVIALDPFIDESFMSSKSVKKIEALEGLLKTSDFVSLHSPLNDTTKGIIGEKELKMMKPDAYLINTGRGGLIDEPILIKALKEKWIAGAGLDVFLKEPIDINNELLKLGNVILTPHAAYYSEQSLQNQRRMAAESALDVLKGGTPRSFINKNLLIKYGKSIS